MLSRRNFLKSGLTTDAAVLPLASSLQALDAVPEVASDQAQPARRTEARLSPLPPRLANPDPSSQPWQKHVRRVGQTNMTEHDPAVMNIDEWADYWHSAQVDVVFVASPAFLLFIRPRFRSIAMESFSTIAISLASA